jgi:CheY-like chemotaxis protein
MATRALRSGGNRALPRSECTSSELISVSRELAGLAEADPAATDLAEQLEKDLIEAGSTELASIRQHCSRYVELVGSEGANEQLDKVYQSVRLLSTRAGLAGCWKIAQLTGAIEAMLYDQVSRSKGGMSPSSIQTLVKAVHCLDGLFTSGDTGSRDSSWEANVLLVDDDQICNMANEVALKRANYETVRVSDGGAALNLLNEKAFDLVLLDINMPGMDGWETLRLIKADEAIRDLPVMMFSVKGEVRDKVHGMQEGAVDYLTKPFEVDELLSRIGRVLGEGGNSLGALSGGA